MKKNYFGRILCLAVFLMAVMAFPAWGGDVIKIGVIGPMQFTLLGMVAKIMATQLKIPKLKVVIVAEKGIIHSPSTPMRGSRSPIQPLPS